MTHHTTDDALCRQVRDWDADPSASAINDEIDICHRCPLLDPCREMTSDMIDKGLRPRGVVQAGMHWDILGRPRGSSRADEPEPEPEPEPRTCKRGHLVDGNNAIPKARGRTQCRACQNLFQRAKHHHRTTAKQWEIEQGEAA